ncbi:hypothetical protein AALP_AA6G197400 [Arabis alpina]|uniref:CRAL-TRIO domain-containing protein n=1 Tax=Arabis alpina TaxID=50452 RepID=A0A087GQD2_ARAAL|nr:hypothetical protein AALP_AA6G197400 [Arabis alpina]
MPQDSATTPTSAPPPPSTADDDSMSNVSNIKPPLAMSQQDQATKPDLNEEEKMVTVEPKSPELPQPPPESPEPNLQLGFHSQPDPLLPLTSKPEYSSEKPRGVTPETLTSGLNYAVEDSEQSRLVSPEKVTLEPDPEEPNHAAEDDSELTQKLMLEQRKKYAEVEDWTELEPPDAAVLEAAASEPQAPEVAAPPAAASVESRSLAEMMNREESEEKPKIQIPRSLGSFKEETNRISDLSEHELNALYQLRHILQESTTGDSCKSSIWGVPLLKDDRSDVVLLKFLRARDFKPQEAYSMLNKTLQWRIDFNIEELLDENLGDDLDKVVFMQGHDKENHPVCYNVYGEFQNKDLYQKTFSDEEKREGFLRWRIQFLEKSIRNLDFVAGGVSTICQVNDLKNSPGPGKTELRLATKPALHLLQDNYPEFVSKQIFINVPWWYLAFYRIISPFMTQRSKSKLVFAGPSRSAETLFKYISPEHVPVQYGGLSVDNCDCNSDFTHDDTATEITIKPSTKQTVEIIIYEKCTIVWEIRVVGWEVLYGAEFVPENKEGYTVIIQKPRKMAAKDEPVVSQSFKVGEVGKILLTVDNPTSSKKMLIYRFKVKPLPCE